MSTLNAKIILNIKTSSEWATSTDVLLEGEVGIESDTRLIKIGDGSSTWNTLPYGSIPDISMLNGVTIVSPTNGEVFTYNNGIWVNSPLPSLPADTDLSHYDNTTSGFITASDIPALPADTDLSHYDNSTSDFATVSQIPTDVSQLNNDAGYITSASIPTVNDGTITIQQNGSNVASFTTNQATNETVNITIPTNISAFNNDVGYLTSASLPSVNDGILTIKQNNTDVGTFSANSAANSAINITVPTKTSDIVNDSGFITSSSIPVVNNGTLTIKQDGNTVATFNANSATNVVANLTSGGGGGGGASYTSQLTVDSSLVPDTDNVYSLGSAASRWTYLYVTYLSSGDGTAITLEQSLVPDTDSSYDLGSSSYNFNAIYTDSIVLNGNTYTSIPTDTSDLTNNAGFITSAALPTVNDATLTIQQNGTNLDTFTANASANKTINIVETIQSASSPLSITSNALSISKANTSTNGYLSSTDWNTFNSKLSSSIFSSTNTWSGKNEFTDEVFVTTKLWFGAKYQSMYWQSIEPGSSGAGIIIGWRKNSTSTERYALALTSNSVYPTNANGDSGIVVLGTANKKWKNVYTDKLNLGGVDYTSIPTDTNDLTNNAGFITASDIPALPSDTDLSHYDNTTSDFVDSNDLATKQDVIDSNNPLSASYVSGLATVATTGEYSDLLNTPTIPTVNDATLTIQRNGTNVATFTANASSNATANISVPTDTSDLTNTAGFITSSDIPIQSASSPLSITSNTLSISQANTNTNGYLSSTDWNTFNGKQDTIDANNKLSSAYLTFNSDIIPTANKTFNLGSSPSGYLANVYTKKITYDTDYIVFQDSGGTQFHNSSNGFSFYTKVNNNDTMLMWLVSSELRSYVSILPNASSTPTLTIGNSGLYNWANVYTKKLTLNGTEYSSIPTKTSQLSNDSGFITGSYLPISGGTLTGNLSAPAVSTTGNMSCGGTLSMGGNITRSSGDLTISASSGVLTLAGNSAIRIRSASAGTANAGTNLRAYTNVTAGKSGNEYPITTYTGSDIRMKKDISNVCLDGLDTINKIHLVNFRYKNETEEHYKHLGIIAQELEKTLPDIKDVVLHGEDDEKDMLFVEYGMFTPYLIKAVQELSSKIDELNAKIKALEENK